MLETQPNSWLSDWYYDVAWRELLIMTGDDPKDERGVAEQSSASSHVRPRVAPVGATPIVWKWWLLAGLFSLAVWAGIVALAN